MAFRVSDVKLSLSMSLVVVNGGPCAIDEK
jgi:hypothetical protein